VVWYGGGRRDRESEVGRWVCGGWVSLTIFLLTCLDSTVQKNHSPTTEPTPTSPHQLHRTTTPNWTLQQASHHPLPRQHPPRSPLLSHHLRPGRPSLYAVCLTQSTPPRQEQFAPAMSGRHPRQPLLRNWSNSHKSSQARPGCREVSAHQACESAFQPAALPLSPLPYASPEGLSLLAANALGGMCIIITRDDQN
jgi:hypothetical protein